ncbi:MAG: hypothetical protein RLY93_18770 [Sumerlaeia bacterium]
MQKILDRLILSDLAEANNPFFLGQHKIQAIMYFGEGGMFPDDLYLYHRPTVKDGKLEDEELRDGIDFLRESLRAGRRVLAVGPTGATIVAAYLNEIGFSNTEAVTMASGSGIPKPDLTSLANHDSSRSLLRAPSLHR